MATSRPHIRDQKQPRVSPTSRSPRTIHSSPKIDKSPSKNSHLSSSEAEDSDYDEFEGFDQPDRSTFGHSPRLYPDLNKPYSPSYTSTPKSQSHGSSYSQSFSESSHSPLRTDCESPPAERQTHRRLGKAKPLSTPNPTPRTQREKYVHRSNHGGPIILITMCILVICAVIFLFAYLPQYFNVPSHGRKNKNLTDIYDEMKVELRTIRRSMEQTRHLWTQVLSQLTSLVDESILQPSVIIAVVPKNSQKTAICLIDSLSKMIKNAFDDHGFIMFDVASHLSNPSSLKAELDANLSGLSESHAAVVYNIEKLPGDAAMMFHSYCDNENAPFKRAIMFLTLEVEPKFDEIDARKLDLVVTQLLMDSWIQKIREEDVSALIARVANAPVLIKPESNDVIRKVCDF